MFIVDEIIEIHATKGLETFEADRITSQTAHGPQAAMIAGKEGASAAMMVAAL